MKRNQKIVINEVPPSLNFILSEARKHWSNYSRLKKVWTQIVCDSLESQSVFKVKHPIRVSVQYTFGNLSRHDLDNYVLKFILDALVKAEIIEDDSNDHIKSIEIKECLYEKNVSRT